MRILMMAALSFSAATALSHYVFPAEWILWIGILSAVLGGMSLFWKDRLRLRWGVIFFALAFAFFYNAFYISVVRSAVEINLSEEHHVEAVVLDYGEPTARRWRIPVRVEGERPLKGMYYGGEEVRDFVPGDVISGIMTVEDASRVDDTPITSFTAKGYFLMLYGKDVTVIRGETPVHLLPKRLARRILDTVDAIFDKVTAPMVGALLLGERGELSIGRENRLSEAGIYHITAVSGMHCGFLLGLFAFLVGRHRHRLLSALAIPMLWLYVLLTGCPASVIRAAVMLTMVLLGPVFDRENDPPTALSFALALLLLVNPYSVAGAGLQLSFGAMAGLLLLTPRISAILPAGRNRLTRFLNYSISASLGVMMLTAPLTAVYFGSLSLVGPLANLLVVPVASVTFALCWGSVLLGMVSQVLGGLLAAVAALGVKFIIAVADVFAAIPFHAVYFDNPYLVYWLLFAASAFCYCACTPDGRRKYALAGILSILTLSLTVALPIHQRQGSLHLAALDVGQGASTLLASGEKTALVDCGSSNSHIDAGDRSADALHTWGYFSLDYLVLTHYHDDHTNGVESILSRMDVDTIFAPVPLDGEGAEMKALAECYGAELRYVEKDIALSLGEAELRLFAPTGNGGNERGLSVLCSAGAFDALITGDMNRSSEKIIAAEKELPDIEVLLVGHHGAANATSEELLDAVTPEVGIISVGDNSYGHPNSETMQRMVRRDMTIYRTDLQGTISLVFP